MSVLRGRVRREKCCFTPLPKSCGWVGVESRGQSRWARREYPTRPLVVLCTGLYSRRREEMATPQPVFDFVNSLQLVGIPSQATPGDRISPRVIPDLSPLPPLPGPPPTTPPNPTLAAFAQTVTLGEI